MTGILFYCVVIYLCITITSLIDDKLIWFCRKKRLSVFKAEILYFEEITEHRWTYEYSVINYSIMGLSVDAIVKRGVKDKIGDQIEIASDGSLAVRTKPYFKKEFMENNILLFVGAVIEAYYVFHHIEDLTYTDLLIGLAAGMAVTIYQLIAYETDVQRTKKKLGWHENL